MSFVFDKFQPINPPARLLMGPGPINADPRVLRAMSAQLIGQYDPAMTHYMNETMALYRKIFNTQNQWTLLIDGTSRAAIEACLVSCITPGDKVLVPVMGRFGHLLVEIAKRCGAEVKALEISWGQVATPAAVELAIKTFKPKLLATVQGDTSTTMLQPLQEIASICHKHGVLTYVDATASIVGNPLDTDDWQLDAVSCGLQKCLGGPSGSGPITLSEKFVEHIRKRHHVEAGIKAQHHTDGEGSLIRSNYFDLPMILDYWGEERLNHHTEATTMLYGARECARIVLEEGLDHCVQRHQLHGRAMASGLVAMQLKLYGDLQFKMNNIAGVFIPDGVDGDALRKAMLEEFSIEIGTSFGPLQGKIWRIGTMGYNARKDAVLTTLAALDNLLRRAGHSFTAGAGVDAALEIYTQ